MYIWVGFYGSRLKLREVNAREEEHAIRKPRQTELSTACLECAS
jgi:hypothetical protein